MDRRNFIKQTLSGLVAFGLGVFGINGCSPGFESVTQMNDAIARISRIQEGIEANT